MSATGTAPKKRPSEKLAYFPCMIDYSGEQTDENFEKQCKVLEGMLRQRRLQIRGRTPATLEEFVLYYLGTSGSNLYEAARNTLAYAGLHALASKDGLEHLRTHHSSSTPNKDAR